MTAPDVTVVNLQHRTFRNGGMRAEIAIGYEDFKKALLTAKAANEIPSFTCTSKYVFRG